MGEREARYIPLFMVVRRRHVSTGIFIFMGRVGSLSAKWREEL
jgi:hypothetical protein